MHIQRIDNRPVRWGIIGAGNIARHAIAPAIRAAQGTELHAVASRSDDRARQLAGELNAPVSHGSYEGLIADPSVDAVYIGLPNGLHEQWTLAALAAGKHVLCEKSLTLTRPSAERMAAAAREQRLLLVEAFMYRHHPQWEIAREILATGRLGQIRGMRAVFNATLDNDADHRWSPEIGGGALFDVTCYGINACRYLLAAEPLTVFANGHGRGPVDATLHIAMSFPGNIAATAIGSLESAFEQELVVTGSKRILRMQKPFIPAGETPLLTLTGPEGTEELTAPAANHFELEIAHFVECLNGTRRTIYPAEDGVANVAACAAAHESWRTGRPVIP